MRTMTVLTLIVIAGLLTCSPAEAQSAYVQRLISEAANRWNLDEALLSAVLKTETDFNADYKHSQGHVMGMGKLSKTGAGVVRSLISSGRYDAQLRRYPSLKTKLKAMQQSDAMDAQLAVEATALLLSVAYENNGGDLAATLAEYKKGASVAESVRKKGLDSPLLSSALKHYINSALDAQQASSDAGLGGGPVTSEAVTEDEGPVEISKPSAETSLDSDDLRKLWWTRFEAHTRPIRNGRKVGVAKQHDPSWISPLIEKAAKRWGVDANLVRALIQKESKFDPQAISYTGALGLGQFTGICRKSVRLAMTKDRFLNKFDTKDSDDMKIRWALKTFGDGQCMTPVFAVEAVALYLSKKMTDYKALAKKSYKSASEQAILEAVLTHYNAGGAMAREVLKHGSHAKAKAEGVLTGSQAKVYAPRLLKYYKQFKAGRFNPEVKSQGAAGALRGLGS